MTDICRPNDRYLWFLFMSPFWRRCRVVHVVFVICLSLCSLPINAVAPSLAASSVKLRVEPHPLFELETSLDSRDISRESIQLAAIIDVLKPLKRLQALRRKRASTNLLTQEEWQEYTDLRLDVTEKIQQARLDIDFVASEIEEEMTGGREIYETYSNRRDAMINRANAYAFRTNGVLWAVAEALDIPTYARPRYSISSGTIGILAGLIPTAFSLYAVHSMAGRHYQRKPYPNMLSKLFGEPVLMRNDFPSSIWRYLSAVPDGGTKSRKEMMIDYWLEDKNIACLKDAANQGQVDLVTGARQRAVTIQVMNDRLTMLGQLKSVVMHMTRPLLELQMIERGLKDIGDDDS